MEKWRVVREACLEITGIIDSLLKTQREKSENTHSAPRFKPSL